MGYCRTVMFTLNLTKQSQLQVHLRACCGAFDHIHLVSQSLSLPVGLGRVEVQTFQDSERLVDFLCMLT